MSRRPKTFLVLILVVMFLMTQVAMAGAATVTWGNLNDIKINGKVTGTLNATTADDVYGTAYASLLGPNLQVIPNTTAIFVDQYIYAGMSFEIPMSGFSGTAVGTEYTVQLNVYKSQTTPVQLLNPQQLSSTAFAVYAATTAPEDEGTPGDNTPGSSGGPGAAPVANPTVTAPASAAIDAAKGGTVTAGGITVTVPAGALSGNGTISVTPVTDLSKTPVGTLFKIGSTVVDIVISDATLTGTLDISLNYDKAAMDKIPAEQIGISYWNEARGGWVYIGGTVDATTGKVTVAVNHLTKFAVIANPNLKIPADITGNWAFDSIKRLLGMGVVAGYTDGSYKPGNNITRAEFAKIMVDAMGWKAQVNPTLKFADAAQIGDWAKGYVATAVYQGLIAGYSDNTFKANNQITRAEIATIVVKALGKTAAGTPAFADSSSIPAWAQGYIAVAVKEGIVAGYSDNTFKATNNATRAEAAKMTTNMLTNLKI